MQHRQPEDGSIELDQAKFLAACKPVLRDPSVGVRHTPLMTVAYALLTRPDLAMFVTALQRQSHKACVLHVKRLNVLLKWAQAHPRKLCYPVMEYPDMLLQISDSSHKARAEDGLSVRGSCECSG